MLCPNFAVLEMQRRTGDGGCHSYTRGMHPNPRFYKYYWWVSHKDSPCDGEAFLSTAYRLSTAAAFQLMQRLQQAGEPYWLYNIQVPRRDPDNTPWDPASPLWQSVEGAPAYDQDPDPEHQGYK
jgi:hypothetical protein